MIFHSYINILINIIKISGCASKFVHDDVISHMIQNIAATLQRFYNIPGNVVAILHNGMFSAV